MRNYSPKNIHKKLGGNAVGDNSPIRICIPAYQTSIKLKETTSALIYLGRVYTLSGKRNEAMAILDKLKTTEKYVSPTELAILYAALGDEEKAFISLEKASTERDFQLTSLKVEPGDDPLRDDPCFQDLMRRVGFEIR
jgi:tetratricopeptide (TPR) repeat protein